VNGEAVKVVPVATNVYKPSLLVTIRPYSKGYAIDSNFHLIMNNVKTTEEKEW